MSFNHTRFAMLLLLLALAFGPAALAGIVTPSAQICVSPGQAFPNGAVVTLIEQPQPLCASATVTPDANDPKLFSLTGENNWQGFFTANLASTINTDPFIQYTVNLTNLTDNPQQFSISITTPIAAVIYDWYEGSINGMLNDGQQNGVLMETVGGNLIVTHRLDGALQFAVGGTKNTPGVFGGASTSTFAPKVFSAMSVEILLRLSGGGDNVSITGRSELFPARQEEIPEPSTYLLFGGGLLGLAAYRRFRK